MNDANFWIDKFQMESHPEGGYFKETFRSDYSIEHAEILEKRSTLTSIYFLLNQGDVSHLHKIASEEAWYWHAGGEIEIIELDENGDKISTQLGPQSGQFSHVVKAQKWFGSKVHSGDFVLVSCAVAPGFDFEDFKLATWKEIFHLIGKEDEELKTLCLS